MTKKTKANAVFTPGSFPNITYVTREDEGLEKKLKFALETKGQVVSVSGPSKSGKTVLVEKVVGSDNLIPLTGAGIRDAAEIWQRVLDWMGDPVETTSQKTLTGSATAEVSATAEGNILVAKGGVGTRLSATVGGEHGTTVKATRTGLPQVVKEIAESDFVILIDDFHYMPRDIQVEAAKQIKEAARLGVKVAYPMHGPRLGLVQ